MARDVRNFSTPVDVSSVVRNLNSSLTSIPDLQVQNICGESGPSTQKCESSVRHMQSAFNQVIVSSNQIKRHSNHALALQSGTSSGAYDTDSRDRAYIAKVRTFAAGLNAAAVAANETVKELANFTKSSAQAENITTFIQKLKNTRSQLVSRDGENIHSAVISASNSLKSLSPVTDGPSAAALNPTLNKLKVAEATMRQNFMEMDKLIVSTRALIDANLTGNLKIYLAGKETSTIHLNKAERDSALLKARLDKLANTIKKLKAELSLVAATHDGQNELIKQYNLAVDKTEYDAPAANATVKDVDGSLGKLKVHLDEVSTVIAKAKQRPNWKKDPKIEAIESAHQKIKTAMKADKTKLKSPSPPDTNDPTELTALKTAITTLKAIKLPALKALSDTRKETISGLRIDLTALSEGAAGALVGASQALGITNRSLTSLSDETSGFGKNFKAEGALASELQSIINEISRDAQTQQGEAISTAANNTKLKLKKTVSEYESIVRQLNTTMQRYDREQAIHESKAYSDIAAIAGSFRIVATAISYQIASVDPGDKRLLIDMAKTANMAAELSNQLTSRANALNTQIGDGKSPGLNRNILSTGQYLRDTQPTAYLEIFDWLKASTRGRTPPKERISIAKRLFENDNWSRVNEVYASGAGDTSMAFIRDEIGNWNLKSFDNDPTELTSAYSNLTLGLIDKAADIATASATSGASTAVEAAANAKQQSEEVSNLTAQAGAVQSGQLSSDLRAGGLLAGIDMSEFRARIVADLDNANTIRDQKVKDLEQFTEPQNASILVKDDHELFIKDGNSLCKGEDVLPTTDPSGNTIPPDPTKKEESILNCKKKILADHVKKETEGANKEARAKIDLTVTRYVDLIGALQLVAAQSPQ